MASDSLITAVEAITAAFAGGSSPIPGEILVHEDTWETTDLLESLAGVNNVPDHSFIERHFSSLPVFTPAGLPHVLPQYLMYSLENPRSDVTERVIFFLSPSETESTHWRDRVEGFSPRQKKAICEYIRHMQSELAGEHYDDDLVRALNVWGCGSL